MNKLRYDLNGGIFGCCGTAKAPLKRGFYFNKWHSDGYKYIAEWAESRLTGEVTVDKTYFGGDDGLEPPTVPVTIPVKKGVNGENVYTVKTVYTDITVDGIKDPAYDYGLRVTSKFSTNPEYYENDPTGFEASIIRGQNGKVYVFIEITDPTTFTGGDLWRSGSYWRDDCVQFSFDMYNTRKDQTNFVFAACGGSRRLPGGEYKVIVTEKGYNVEFCFDNRGLPIIENDMIGFNVYLNDCTRFVSVGDHDKNSLTTAPALGCDGYHSPNPARSDAIIFSLESATGNVKISEKEKAPKTGKILDDIASGAASAAIVYSNSASAYTCECIRKAMLCMRTLCPNIIIAEDTVDHGSDYEILVGLTNRAESREIVEKTPYNGYSIEIKDEKVLLVGWLEKALDNAIELLVSAIEYAKYTGKQDDLSVNYGGILEDIVGAKIPAMDDLSMVTDAGGGAYLILSQNSTEAAYREYISKLTDAGYSVYTENKMVKTLCTTLVNEDSVVNVTFGGEGDPHLRAVVDPIEGTALPALEVAPYKKISASKVIQVAPNFMCYLIKLDNGEFLAFDSGNNKVEAPIYEQLMKNSEDEHPVIAAWFFSHFHQDHIGGFIDFVANDEYMKNVTIKSVVYNFPEDQVILTARGSRRDMQNIHEWPERLAKCGCTPIRARTGQKFRFANAEIEAIFTYEDLMPFFVYQDRSNPTSNVFSVNIEGQRLIITGDCCGEATRLMANKYGEGLKTDFVQLPHHGWGDGGTALEFYEKCDAPWVLYPGDKYAPSPSEKWACEHSKRYFLREFTTKTIPLPYDGGEYDFEK